MADKNDKTDAAPADPRDALLAKLQAQVADLAKGKKAAEAALADANDYTKELEGELKEAATDAGAVSGEPSERSLIKTLVDGQAQLAAALSALLETKNGPKQLTHDDTLVNGKVPLDPKYKGTHYYRRTRPGYAKGSYFEAGLTFDARTGAVGNLKVLTDEAPGSTDVEVDAKGNDLKPTEAGAPPAAVIDSAASTPASSPSKTEV